MLLRDPVHGLVVFEGDAERVVTRLLGTREVQRLRLIRQLGFTSLVFPGAEHSRFAHALGAAHVMARLLRRVHEVQDVLPSALRVDDEAFADAIAAALLHDLGHGPFSHLFEDVLPGARHHEAWTADIIVDTGTEVHAALEALSAGMAGRVAALLSATHPLGYLARAISGPLDADRCDYLLRDSHMTGVGYGRYDLDWLLQALVFTQLPECDGERDWVLAIEGRKGLPPIEGFFLARQFMYEQVYHHKATRAAECLIRAILTRAGELVREGTPPDSMPAALRQASLREPVTLGDYLELDDVAMLACFRAWEQEKDSTLAGLARGLARRELPKTIPLAADGGHTGAWQRAAERAEQVATAHGLRPELSVWLDVPWDVPYEEPDEISPAGLWVQLRHRLPQRLGDVSFLLGELRNKRIERPRLIVSTPLRDPVLAALGDTIA